MQFCLNPPTAEWQTRYNVLLMEAPWMQVETRASGDRSRAGECQQAELENQIEV